MRTTICTTMWTLAAIAAATLGACKWTEFDDLENETWVSSTQKPERQVDGLRRRDPARRDA